MHMLIEKHCVRRNAATLVARLDSLLRPQVGAASSRVLVGTVLLTSKLGVVQSAGVAESPGAIGTASPLWSLSAVAAVATTRRSSTTSAFLRVSSSEATSGFVRVRRRRWRRCYLRESFLLLTLFRSLLLVCNLLSYNNFTDLGECLKLKSGLGHHVLHFDHARKRGRGWAGT